MSRNKIKFLYLYLAIAMAVSIAFWLAYIVRGPNTRDSVVSMKGTTSYTNPPASSKPNAGPEKTGQVNGNTLMESTGGISLEDTAIAGALKDKYGAGIFNVRVQMYAMEKLMAYMKTRYPDKWQERMFSILRIAFPELAETMIDRFKRLLDYKNWLLDNQEYLRSLSLKERQDMLWERCRLTMQRLHQALKYCMVPSGTTTALPPSGNASDIIFSTSSHVVTNSTSLGSTNQSVLVLSGYSVKETSFMVSRNFSLYW